MRLNWLLKILLILCIGRFWLMPLPSSFWVDEMGTAFVVHYGAGHRSLAVAPQVPESIYYVLPSLSEKVLGFSEIAYRIPSVVAMGLALLLIGRLGALLLHPDAGWFAVFACLALRGFNYEAADARPYALGIAVAAASVIFLVRWLDQARWLDAVLFAGFAALLWRVHLVFWPFYFVFAVYAIVRLLERDARVSWWRAAVVFGLLGVALIPVLANALALYREAKAHVIVAPPTFRDLANSFKAGLVLECAAGAWLLRKLFRDAVPASPPTRSSVALILAWWGSPPLGLFAFSWLTGNSVFVSRYLALALPGTALAATAAAAFFLPRTFWKPAAAVLAIAAFMFLGQWRNPWPPHHNSGWRTAAARANQESLGPETPLIYTSPFIEAKPPVWRPDYPLPGFLYAHLPVYPIRGKAYLFPFETSFEAELYADKLSRETLSRSVRFLLYGGDVSVWFWRDWFARRPELSGWHNRRLGPFGDVEVFVFDRN